MDYTLARTLARTLFRSNTLDTEDPADRTLPAGDEVAPALPAAPETEVPDGVAPTFFAAETTGGRAGAVATRIVVVVMFNGFLTGLGDPAAGVLVPGGTLMVVVVLALAVWGAGGFLAAVVVEGVVEVAAPVGFLTGVAEDTVVLRGRPVSEGVALRDPVTEGVVEEGVAARTRAATVVTVVAVVDVRVLVGVAAAVEGVFVVADGFGDAGVLAVELPATARRTVV